MTVMPVETRRRHPGAGGTGSCVTPHRCWECNSGPLLANVLLIQCMLESPERGSLNWENTSIWVDRRQVCRALVTCYCFIWEGLAQCVWGHPWTGRWTWLPYIQKQAEQALGNKPWGARHGEQASKLHQHPPWPLSAPASRFLSFEFLSVFLQWWTVMWEPITPFLFLVMVSHHSNSNPN